MENEFYEWAKSRVQHETTVDGYIQSITKDIPQKLGITSVFDITNIQELHNIYQRCGVGGGLYDWNMSIGNGRPKASVGNYIKFIQYKSVIEVMRSYRKNSDDFPLNGAINFFKITDDNMKYPVKAICRTITKELELQENFTTNDAKRKLRNIFNNGNIEFIDINNPLPDDRGSLPINSVKNIILYGVPGVGKTYNTKKLISLLEMGQAEKDIFLRIEENSFNNDEEAAQLVENIKERVKFITFHQSFGYEDFIEGFRPNENGEIKLAPGVFKELCEEAEDDRENKYYLVIDEINRGNISKIFGELITLIEEDKRDSLHVTLPYSKEEFSIPSNLYIIGTMNSTDKSIALIDIALRRRFTFIHMTPNPELVTKYKKANELMIALNDKLLDEHKIGHSYFMQIENEEELAFTCKYKIKSLLEEYFYGDEVGLKEIVDILKSYI